LTTFEVAAKHLSFTLAAKELNITQGAVSQQIRILEKALQLPLFIRKHNALELTAAGSDLFAAVAAGWIRSARAWAFCNQTGNPNRDRIGHRRHGSLLAEAPYGNLPCRPSVSRRIILGSDEDDTLRNYSGVAIARLCGNERIEVGEELHFLFPEAAHPVCSPDYLDTGIHPSRPWLKAGAAHRGTQRPVGDRRAGMGPPTSCPQHG
jgi:DNA-binding transcriptional LysR family regulator